MGRGVSPVRPQRPLLHQPVPKRRLDPPVGRSRPTTSTSNRSLPRSSLRSSATTHYALMDDGSLKVATSRTSNRCDGSRSSNNSAVLEHRLVQLPFHYAERATLACGSRPIPRWPTAPGASATLPTSLRPWGTTAWPPLTSSPQDPDLAHAAKRDLQIQQLAPTYIKLKSVNVFHQAGRAAHCSGIVTSKCIAEVSGGSFVVGRV